MHIAYCGMTLKVVLIKVTIMRYKIKHAEQIAHFVNNDFSEGIGCPSKAVLTFMRLKVYQELNGFQTHSETQTYRTVTMSRLLIRKWNPEMVKRAAERVQM